MSTLPTHVSHRRDEAIHRLNTTYDLKIPESKAIGRASDVLGQKCKDSVTYLCSRDGFRIGDIIRKYELLAAKTWSKWIHKPSQQTGTILSLPVTKSLLQADAKAQYGKPLTVAQRRTLLELLLSLLEEERLLCDMSTEYFGPTFTPNTESISPDTSRSASSASFVTAKSSSSIRTSLSTKRMLKGVAPSNQPGLKKRTLADATASNQKNKRVKQEVETVTEPPNSQPTLSQTFRRCRERLSAKSSTEKLLQPARAVAPMSNDRPSDGGFVPPSTNSTTGVDGSFDTVVSDVPGSIFSESEDGIPSSTDTTTYMSDEDSQLDTQYSGNTELEAVMIDDITLSRSLSNKDLPTTSIERQLKEIARDGPFRPAPYELSSGLPYWYVFELYRISLFVAEPVGLLHKKLFELTKSSNYRDYDTFWSIVRKMCRDMKTERMPPKSDAPAWGLKDETSYCDKTSGNSFSFSGKLTLNPNPIGKLFAFHLQPIKHEKSCRFHRKFGADRFLIVDIPYFDYRSICSTLSQMPKSNIAQQLKEISQKNQLHERIFTWLFEAEHHIAGRVWRAYDVEPKKTQSKKKRKEEGMLQRLHLFAIDGSDFKPQPSTVIGDHSPISLLEFANWHMPLLANIESPAPKLFARFALARSKTTATIVFKAHEFLAVEDRLPRRADGSPIENGEVMTDGCARISHAAAMEIWKQCGKVDEDMPSAFQARISGAKGMWIVDYDNGHQGVSNRSWWIEISPSQLKIKPHPQERTDAEEALRTFEVLKCSRMCDSAHLNTELINILHNRGVDKSRLRKVLESDLIDYLGDLEKAFSDPFALRSWLQGHHSTADAAGIAFRGDMPSNIADEVALLLESGFNTKNWYLVDRLRALIRTALDSYVDKLRICVPCSTTVFCIPDPLAILQPGEIQLNFSRSWTHPITKMSESYLEDLDVIVSRNPARLASDAQKVRAVYKKELRHLKNVIIFPVLGEMSLASMLSGGDYDGDTILAIWDPELVRPFKNAPIEQPPGKADCYIKSEKWQVKAFLDTVHPTDEQLKIFLRYCGGLNGMPSYLGQVTAEHDRLIYADCKYMDLPAARKLAALCGWLVDGPKQGDSLDQEGWNKLRSETTSKLGLKEPAYKQSVGKAKPARDWREECQNVIDYLKFDIADRSRDKILTKFNYDWGVTSELDAQLKQLYNDEFHRAEHSKEPEKELLKSLLKDLTQKMRAINAEWLNRCPKNEEELEKNNFLQLVEEMSEKLKLIEPLDVDCDISRDFRREGGDRGTRWSMLRASCLFYHYYRTSMVWKLCGVELCRIKARAQGMTWEMTLPMRGIMKADKRRVRRMLNDDNDDNDIDEFV